jgi:hypothetical protein
VSEFAPQCAHIHPVQPGEVLAEDLALGLLGERRIPVALDQILWDLKVPEGVQGPPRMPDRRLRAVDDLVLAGPKEQFAEPLRMLGSCAVRLRTSVTLSSPSSSLTAGIVTSSQSDRPEMQPGA